MQILSVCRRVMGMEGACGGEEGRCEGGVGVAGAGWRSSFIKSLREVAPVVFLPVHQRRRRRRRRRRRWRGRRGRDSPEEHRASAILPPWVYLSLSSPSPPSWTSLPSVSSDSSPPDCYYSPFFLPSITLSSTLSAPSITSSISCQFSISHARRPPSTFSVRPSLSSFLHFSGEAAPDSQMSPACQKLLLTFQFSVFFSLTALRWCLIAGGHLHVQWARQKRGRVRPLPCP